MRSVVGRFRPIATATNGVVFISLVCRGAVVPRHVRIMARFRHHILYNKCSVYSGGVACIIDKRVLQFVLKIRIIEIVV